MKFQLITIAIIAFSLIPAASATCLSPQQIIMISSLFNNTNMTTGDRDVFFAMFDSLCDRCYTKNESDALMDDYVSGVNTVNTTVRAYMDNYTQWFEGKENIAGYMKAVVEVMNATSDIDSINRRVEGQLSEMEDQFDDKLNGIEDDMKGFATSGDIARSEMNVTARVNAMEASLRRDFADKQSANTGFILLAIVIVGVAVFFVLSRRNDGKMRSLAMMKGIDIVRPRRQTKQDELLDADTRERIRATQETAIAKDREAVGKDIDEETKETAFKEKLRKGLK